MTTTPTTAPPRNPRVNSVRVGVRRAGRELHQIATNMQDLLGNTIWLVGMIAPLVILRDNDLGFGDMSVAHFILPSVMAMVLAFNGFFSLAQQLVVERQDGTLLRVKALPYGMISYLVGKILLVSGIVIFACTIVVLSGVIMLDGVSITNLHMWLTLAWLIPLSLLAMLPAGAVLGSLIENPRNMSLIMLPMFAIVSVSGIFYPAARLPDSLQFFAEIFPLYWIGLGARSALLPEEMVAAEIGESWRYLETVGVLGIWGVVGLLIAPALLRRVARRESGSTMASRRERALQRTI